MEEDNLPEHAKQQRQLTLLEKAELLASIVQGNISRRNGFYTAMVAAGLSLAGQYKGNRLESTLGVIMLPNEEEVIRTAMHIVSRIGANKVRYNNLSQVMREALRIEGGPYLETIASYGAGGIVNLLADDILTRLYDANIIKTYRHLYEKNGSEQNRLDGEPRKTYDFSGRKIQLRAQYLN